MPCTRFTILLKVHKHYTKNTLKKVLSCFYSHRSSLVLGDLIFLRTSEPSKEGVINLGSFPSVVLFFSCDVTALPHRPVKKVFLPVCKIWASHQGKCVNNSTNLHELWKSILRNVMFSYPVTILFFFYYFSILVHFNEYSFLYFHSCCKLVFTHFCKLQFSDDDWDWFIFRKMNCMRLL